MTRRSGGRRLAVAPVARDGLLRPSRPRRRASLNRVGDRREHARLVDDLERDLVAGGDARPIGRIGRFGVGRLGDARPAGDVAARGRDEVAEHGGCGLHAAGAGAVEHQVAGGLGLTNTALFAPCTAASGCVERNERRVHARADALDAGRRHPSSRSQTASSLTT